MRKNELLLMAAWVADPGSADVERIKEAWTSLLTGLDSGEVIRRYVQFQDAPAKLELGLTVAQLVMLLRFLQAEGVFGTLRIATLLRFFSKHFRTRKQEQLSYGSMNKLFYSGDQFTAAFIRDLLLKMIARINHTYFPN